MRAQLDRERLVLIAEGVPGTLEQRDAPGPTRRGTPRRSVTLGALAITQQRLLIQVAGEPLVDAAWDSGEARDLDLAAREKELEIAFDAERFTSDRTGRITLSLRIRDAAVVQAAIEQRRRPLEPRRRSTGA